MSLRIDIGELSPAARESLSRGETIEVADHGAVVARLEPERRGLSGWAEYLERRRGDPPVDYDEFLQDIETSHAELNTTVDDSHWA